MLNGAIIKSNPHKYIPALTFKLDSLKEEYTSYTKKSTE